MVSSKNFINSFSSVWMKPVVLLPLQVVPLVSDS
jgi:hypothetical protein